jgi:hypothetical protein
VQLSVSTVIEFDKDRSEQRSAIMADTQTRGGFSGDPGEALTVAGTSGCCGNAPQATLLLPDPAVAPCCGSAAAAAAENSCCGSAAKAGAVEAQQGCCG